MRLFVFRLFVLPSLINNVIKLFDGFLHFRNLKFADNNNEQNKKIDLLIGAYYYHEFYTDEIIRDKEGWPVAQNTIFGWVFSGNISTFDSKNLSFITSMQINTSPVLNSSTEFKNEVFEKESLGI